jgi:adenylate kinase
MTDNSRKLAIIMVGAPGSGKGTQGELLEKHTGFKRYVMSDLIKKELKPGNKIYEDLFKKGNLLGDEQIFEIFRKHFKSEKQVIIDGIPRTLDQAYWLYGFLMRHSYEIELVYLKVNEKKLIDRITSRWYCPKCHRLYNTNIKDKMPKKEEHCDDDNEKLIQREDDTKDVFGERVKIFDQVKNIIFDVYKGDMIEISGDNSIDKVSQELIRKIILR